MDHVRVALTYRAVFCFCVVRFEVFYGSMFAGLVRTAPFILPLLTAARDPHVCGVAASSAFVVWRSCLV